MTVRKAVIPAAGLGTRFLPATKAQAKEMIPVVDRPGIQYVVEEAVRAGIDDICIVTSRGKEAIEAHFDRSPELEERLASSGKKEELDEIRAISELADIYYVRQKEPLGFGHAVALARRHVGDEPFAVLVGDELVPEPMEGESDLLPHMIEVYEETGASVIAVQEVAPEHVSAYGIITPAPGSGGDVVRMLDMVEKPPPEEAASNLASRGRYVLSPGIFDALDRTPPGVGDEIQLTDGIKMLMAEAEVYAYVYRGFMFDVGKKLDYLKATVTLALRRPDLGDEMRRFLADLVAGF